MGLLRSASALEVAHNHGGSIPLHLWGVGGGDRICQYHCSLPLTACQSTLKPGSTHPEIHHLAGILDSRHLSSVSCWHGGLGLMSNDLSVIAAGSLATVIYFMDFCDSCCQDRAPVAGATLTKSQSVCIHLLIFLNLIFN